MKAVLCRAFGPPDSLEVAEIDPPSPVAGEIRIRVHAAGVNFPDVLLIAGKYQARPPFPFAPGAECAGEVIELGEGVADFQKGDRVIAPTGHGSFASDTGRRFLAPGVVSETQRLLYSTLGLKIPRRTVPLK